MAEESPQVIIDALAARFGGAAYASVHLAGHLSADERFAEVVLVTREGSIVAHGTQPRARLRVILLPRLRRHELLRRLTWETLRLPGLLRSEKSVVITWSGILPRHGRARVVCYFANPLVFQDAGVGNTLRLWAARRTAQRAMRLVAPTEAMGAMVAAAVRRPVGVVPLGIDRSRFRPAETPGSDVLYIGDFYPHKRHELAIAAWAALPEPRPTLRLVGDPRVDPDHASAILDLAARHRRLGEIAIEANLSLEQVVSSYHRARVLVMTSVRESFSMPLLEAQACGTPAVVRDLPALRETGGRAIRFVSGDDPMVWAGELRRLISDSAVHAEASRDGLRHAAEYSWERTAREMATEVLAAAHGTRARALA